jgi:hypothetical protein
MSMTKVRVTITNPEGYVINDFQVFDLLTSPIELGNKVENLITDNFETDTLDEFDDEGKERHR